jgi:hypothetical protein
VVGVFRFDGDAVAGEESLFAFQVDPTGATAFSAATDLDELDAGSGSPGTPYSVLNSGYAFNAVINRTGEWILVPWRQNQVPASAIAAMWVHVIQAPRSEPPPALNTVVSGALRVDQGGVGGTAVTDFTVQAETGYGGIQSDRNTIALAWEQSSGAGLDTLRFNTFGVTLGTPPTISGGSEGRVDFNPGSLIMSTVTVLDGGGAGGTPGAPILYYVRNSRASAPSSFRAYQYRSGAGEIEVGSLSDLTAGTYHPREALKVTAFTTPRNVDVAALLDWAGRTHHVVVTEYRHHVNSGSTALRHRIFDKDSEAPAGADRFSPVADGVTPPTELDTGVDLDATWIGSCQDDETVGVFFQQGNHVWYMEYSGLTGAWSASPILVDDRWPDPATLPGLLLPHTAGDPDDLHGAVIFWRKNLSSTTDRLFIRVRY